MGNLTKLLRASIFVSLAAASALAVLSRPAAAAPDLCAGQAMGVPTRPGPPKWFNWSGSDVVDPNIDDPRWLNATGKNFQFTNSGGAKAPVETKALWSVEGTEFLYLSFLVNVDPLSTTPRDLYLGFRLPASFDPTTLDATYTGGPEFAYIFQFHLDNTPSGGPTNLITPIRCDTDSTCGELGTAPTNMWRMFVDHNDVPSQSCADVTAGTITGEQFRLLAPDVAHPLADPPAWVNDAVRYWKLDSSPTFPTLKNQWAVQIRVPIIDPATTTIMHPNIRQGVIKGSKIWYELTADVGPNRTSLTSWPTTPDLTTHVCQRRSLGQISLVHPDLRNDAKWSLLTDFNFGDPAPADCAGIALDQADIGAIFNPAVGTNYNTVLSLTTDIKAYLPGTTTAAPNEIVARIHNSSTADITGDFIARFRLANWGAAWPPGDRGTFNDVPLAAAGICASGSAPPCGAVTVNPRTSTMPNNVAMHFTWQLGNNPDASEYCKFKITPPGAGASCGGCNCATDPQAACDATTDTGTKAVVPGSPTAYKCVSARFEHECMMVEVDAPTSSVNFVNRSNWNNMQFEKTSKTAQTASIDVRGLPKAPGQLTQDVYLVVMPRNMPATISPPVSGVDFIRGHVDAAMAALSRPYLEDIRRTPPNSLAQIRESLKRRPLWNPNGGLGGNTYGGSGYGGDGGAQRKPNEAELRLIQAAQIMPQDDFDKAQALLRVALIPDGPGQAEKATHVAVDALGPNAAADVVPTLDIYAFYRVDPAGVKTQALYLPMTSFSVFLFHDATPLAGMRWEIDGFQKVSENVYHQVIPVDRIRKIQVRAQSVEAGEALIPPGNPRWPCAGCCGGPNCGTMAGINNAAPGFIAGVFVFGRRRKKRPAAR